MTGRVRSAAVGPGVSSIPGTLVTIIIGDGPSRAASVPQASPGQDKIAAGDPAFVGMTVAEALRRDWSSAEAPVPPRVAIRLEDRGGVISLLDIADAFEALSDRALDLDGMSAPVGGRPVCEGLRHQLISAISQGRVY